MWWPYDHNNKACKGVAIIEEAISNLFHVKPFFVNTVFFIWQFYRKFGTNSEILVRHMN